MCAQLWDEHQFLLQATPTLSKSEDWRWWEASVDSNPFSEIPPLSLLFLHHVWLSSQLPSLWVFQALLARNTEATVLRRWVSFHNCRRSNPYNKSDPMTLLLWLFPGWYGVYTMSVYLPYSQPWPLPHTLIGFTLILVFSIRVTDYFLFNLSLNYLYVTFLYLLYLLFFSNVLNTSSFQFHSTQFSGADLIHPCCALKSDWFSFYSCKCDFCFHNVSVYLFHVFTKAFQLIF